jgi:hypothetical protein
MHGSLKYRRREPDFREPFRRKSGRSVTLGRMILTQKSSLACAMLAAVLIAGCGSSASSSTGAATSAGAATASSGSASGGSSTSATGGGAASGAGALSADAGSAATGDIPDNQVFLVFRNRAAGYSINYPEGWTRTGTGGNVTFHDKNNLVHVSIAHGPAPTTASVTTQLNALKRSNPRLAFSAPRTMTIGSSPAVKAVYSTRSAPNPVTGKRVELVVNRYEFGRGGRVATVDLGTPKGVDNVDAYRMMIESFRWL